jgi:hypothetical protein
MTAPASTPAVFSPLRVPKSRIATFYYRKPKDILEVGILCRNTPLVPERQIISRTVAMVESIANVYSIFHPPPTDGVSEI